MEAKFYPVDKTRFLLIIALFIVLTIGSLIGLYIIYTNPNDDGNIYIPNLLITLHIIGVLGTVVGIINLALDKKGLTINNNGITFNVGLYNFGPIVYDDIMAVDKKRYMMNDFIVLHLHNPGAFMATKKGISKRMYDENHSTHGSPAVINITQLNGDNDAILAEIKSRLQPKN
jgi:hypothetical protein